MSVPVDCSKKKYDMKSIDTDDNSSVAEQVSTASERSPKLKADQIENNATYQMIDNNHALPKRSEPQIESGSDLIVHDINILGKRKRKPIQGENIRPKTENESDAKGILSISETKVAGHVCVFGQGDSGQLGLGSDCMEAPFPTPVDFKREKILQVCCGGMHTLILTVSGLVYSCGCNDEGALGRDVSDDSEYNFKQVKFPKDVKITKLVAGDSFSAALDNRGRVFAWGTFRDSNGVIGLIKPKTIQKTPTIFFSVPEKCSDICGGGNHLLILTFKGSIFSCGSPEEGQLGRIASRSSSRDCRRGLIEILTPRKVPLIISSKIRRDRMAKNSSIKSIFATNCASFAVLANGSVFAWGLNASKQLCPDEPDIIYHPKLIDHAIGKLLENGKFEPFICGGYMHTLILNILTGVIYTAGNHTDCCLGRSDLDPNFKEIELPDPSLKFVSCNAGDTSCFAISTKGDLFSWGLGCTNQLGFGHDADVPLPTHVISEFLSNKKILSLSAGGQHTALIYR